MIRKFGRGRAFPLQPQEGSHVCDLLFKREARQSFTTSWTSQRPRRGEPRRSSTPRLRGKRSFSEKIEGRAEAQQETRGSEGAGRWACLTQQPPPVRGCVKVELHSACVPPLLEGVATRTHALLLHTRWVARSSVGSRVARRLPGRPSTRGD